MDRFGWTPDASLERMRAEVPRELAEACAGVDVQTVLQLGAGEAYTPPRHAVALRAARLDAALPRGPFDLVVCEFAARGLDPSARGDLFVRVAACLRPGGRFVLAASGPVDDQLGALSAAGFDARTAWTEGDLAVIAADLPAPA
jgi:hypothetical protein